MKNFFNEITQNESEGFKNLILESSKDYVSRSNRSLNLGRFVEQSTKFLKEECAVIRVLSKDINKVGIFYPGPPLSIFEYIIDRINNDFREKNRFFYKEMKPTKEKRKDEKLKLSLFSELPFFKANHSLLNYEHPITNGLSVK